MATLEKSKLITSTPHIGIFLKSGILIYNSKVPNATGRKIREKRGRTQAIAKRFAFRGNAKNVYKILSLFL